MEEQKIAKDSLILKVRVGSRLYGTSTPESDEDFVGIFLPPVEYLIGLRRVNEVNAGVTAKGENGKNTKDAIDFTCYTLEKFARLALENNPNILEVLFVNKENIVYWHPLGAALLKMRYKFLSKCIKQRFLNYALSQKHNMVIKLENYKKLSAARDYLLHTDKRFMIEIIESEVHPVYKSVFKREKDEINIGDLIVPATATTKRTLRQIQNRLDKFGSRQELVKSYGYDTKFACNLIRLMSEGVELLETGDLKFPLKEAPLIKNIRYGKYTMEEVLKMSEEYENRIESLSVSSAVPELPDYDAISKFVMDVHRTKICES